MNSSQFAQLAQSVLELDRHLDALQELADSCGAPSPEHQDWYALLKHKLIPQLSDKAFLIVAVMGGTNTGKSLVFNHLVSEHFSAVDPRASGTKHPVCLVPTEKGPDFDAPSSMETILARHFDSFRLIPWANQEQPLELGAVHHLFWTEGKKVPSRLMILDTPDIDSDREVNWERARQVRHAADVIVCVLTEQKYNDAAVRRFFREAAEAEKPIIVLFNMLDFATDQEHLPGWIEQFCEETGVRPFSILASPHDKSKAVELQIPFHAVNENGTIGEPVELDRILSDLHFDSIKSQTLLGALKVLDDPVGGVKFYLNSVEAASHRFSEALEILENVGETDIDWPGMPSFLLAEEIRTWWHEGRPGWSQNINGVYRRVGSGLLWPIRKASNYISSQYLGNAPMPDDPLEHFREQENKTIVEFVGRVIARLETLAETNNPVLRRELLELIGGEHRVELLNRAHGVLNSLEPIDDDFRKILRTELSDWAQRNPKMVDWIRSLDNVATVARPIVTVTLAMTGFAIGAQVVGQMVGEVAVAGGVTAGGEAILHAGSEGAKRSTAKLFQRIQEEFVIGRSRRFYTAFQQELWQNVIERLRIGASVADSETFLRCKNWTAYNEPRPVVAE